MQERKRFNAMPVRPRAQDVVTRIGAPQSRDAALLSRAQRELSALRPDGLVGQVPIAVEDHVVRVEGREIESASLAAYLSGCTRALVLASTLGPGIVARIAELFRTGRADEAVWVDAAASVAVDEGLDFLCQAMRPALQKRNMRLLPHRYSPGYGDCPVAAQRVLFDCLNAQELGIGLTEACMLTPEKSVMALCGVRDAKEAMD